MKCVCGYEHEEGFIEKEDTPDEWGIIKGDEDFIQLDVHVTMRKDYADKKVKLWACPKCSMVVAEINRW